jgi:hypothetical protein
MDHRPESAIAAARKSVEKVFHMQFEAVGYHDLGRARESQAALDAMIAENSSDAPFQIACVYAWRGEADKAFEWLDRALAAQDGGVSEIRLEPLVRSLRRDPRYKALERKIGLPVD